MILLIKLDKVSCDCEFLILKLKNKIIYKIEILGNLKIFSKEYKSN